jgi:hypothetical protein
MGAQAATTKKLVVKEYAGCAVPLVRVDAFSAFLFDR